MAKRYGVSISLEAAERLKQIQKELERANSVDTMATSSANSSVGTGNGMLLRHAS